MDTPAPQDVRWTWNVLKDYLEAQGFVEIIGSKNATRQAFKNALIAEGDVWMDMIKARNECIDELLLAYTVDLSIFATINHPELEAHIERVGLELYRKASMPEIS